jgi:hypothetical protein
MLKTHSFSLLNDQELEWSLDSNILRCTSFTTFLNQELERFSHIPHRGEMMNDSNQQSIRTRALYFHVYMYLLSQLCINKQSGVSSNVTISLPMSQSRLTIKRAELLMLWFFLFNFGHLMDTKSAERFVMYQLWRECTHLDDDVSSILYTSDLPKHSINFDYKLPFTKKNTKASPVEKFSDSLSEPSLEFLKGFPDKCREYSASIIRKGRWSQFHHALAVWRVLNYPDSSIQNIVEVLVDDKLQKITLSQLFLAALEEFSYQNLNLKLTTDITTLSVLRMLSYLNMDPPEDSIFLMNIHSISAFLRTDRHCIARLYDQLDLRGRQLIDQNDFYFNSVCMHPYYVEKQCRCILYLQEKLNLEHCSVRNHKKQLELVTQKDYLLRRFSERAAADNNYTQSRSLEYAFSLPFPTSMRGDMFLYKHLNMEWKTSNIYVVEWMGHTRGNLKNSFTECYFFFSPKTNKLYKYFKSLAMAWISEFDSIYLGTREIFRELPVPISRITNSIVDYIFRRATGFNDIAVHPELHESNRITELPWTLCWGFSDALQSIQEAHQAINSRLSLMNKHKGVKYESFGLAKAFTAMTQQADTNAFFIILWGGLQIEINYKKREFDFCWICITEANATIYVGEYKSGTEDALNCTKEKLEYLDIQAQFHVVQKPRCSIASISEVTHPILAGNDLIQFIQEGRIQHFSRYNINLEDTTLDQLMSQSDNVKQRAICLISKMNYDKHNDKVKKLVESIEDIDLDQRDHIIKFTTSLESSIFSQVQLNNSLVRKLLNYFQSDLKKNRTFLKILLHKCDLSLIQIS